MVSCQGCGEETTSRLCCPKCSEFGRTTFFCSQDCFVSSWPSHSKLHVIIKQSAMNASPLSSDACTDDGFDDSATTAASLPTPWVSSTLSTRPSSLVSSTDTPSYSRTLGSGGDNAFPNSRLGTELPVVPPRSSLHPSSSLLTSRTPAVPSTLHESQADSDAESRQHESSPRSHTSSGVFGKVRNFLTAAGDIRGSASALPTSLDPRSSGRQRHASKGGGGGAYTSAAKRLGALGALTRASSSTSAGRRCCWMVFCLLACAVASVWLMRRMLSDASDQNGMFDVAQGDLSSNSSGAAPGGAGDSTVVSSMFAHIGGRRYADELSALNESVQDLRNELAAVTTLVQQHAAVISQFLEKPSSTGRRQGGAGALNHPMSASVEGPPLPEAPHLRFGRGGGSGGEAGNRANDSSGTGMENAEPGDANFSGDRPDSTRQGAGVLLQKSFGASVAPEGDAIPRETRESPAPAEDTAGMVSVPDAGRETDARDSRNAFASGGRGPADGHLPLSNDKNSAGATNESPAGAVEGADLAKKVNNADSVMEGEAAKQTGSRSAAAALGAFQARHGESSAAAGGAEETIEEEGSEGDGGDQRMFLGLMEGKGVGAKRGKRGDRL
ncbi:hypothetical protein BESB_017350 [Besnoitia besnoiti]|uniref:C6H2-type domain-containing protein n=1 Tax=Besnoitia besnoiti TaxID=94643 RepID=A0A2A9M9Y1_BESBE|nr:hypothetical protein BESB_017350 [Besnoitia besnoiti]PFH32417.1 hypothetical protein BESB_017350 [Besnoitia besnoiti]